MSVIVNVGRRLPRAWFRRQATRVKGLMSFQENIWLIIKQSLNIAKKQANASGKIKFVMNTEHEIEDLNYELEWLRVVIQGNKEDEKEEYEDALKFHEPLGKILKKEMTVDDNMKKTFRTKVLTSDKIQNVYKEGLSEATDKSVSNKLLEMGILTHVEWIDDFDSRGDFYPSK